MQEITDRIKFYLQKHDINISFAMHALELQKKLELGGEKSVVLGRRSSNLSKKRNRKLEELLGSNEEDRFENCVKRIILDVNTEEGYTISFFCKNENQLVECDVLCHQIRQFMDSMRYHMIDTRRKELSKLIVSRHLVNQKTNSKK